MQKMGGGEERWPDPVKRYNSEFQTRNDQSLEKTVGAFVPVLVELFRPERVVDVGCGTGQWLAAFSKQGVPQVLGIDAHDGSAGLTIPRDCFRQHDLTAPLTNDREYDLVLCLSVGECLPESSARQLVATLCQLGKTVCFEAASPFQSGPRTHVTEHWPTWWAALFAEHGYVPLDCVRDRLWHRTEVTPSYAQNTIVYMDPNRLRERHPDWKAAVPTALDRVHPRMYMTAILHLVRAEVPGKIPLFLMSLASKVFRHPNRK
jgi:SAM-dependent methyltransferase